MSQPQLLATDLVIGESARWHDSCPGCRTAAPKRFSRTTWKASRSHNPGADASLNRLRVDAINLFHQHRVDPEGAHRRCGWSVKDLIREGKAKHFGMSEAAAKTSVGRTRSSRSGRCRASTRCGEDGPRKRCCRPAINSGSACLGQCRCWVRRQPIGPAHINPDNGEPEHPTAGGARSRGSGRTAR
jgi:hypothetical protein